jgi:hypothetical protein
MENKILRNITRILIVTLLVTSVLALLPAASAAVDKVICVPWQGDINKYHTTWSGQDIFLKGVIKTDSSATIWYKWNFGDGTESSVVSLSGNTKYNVEIKHTYTGAVGTPFTAQLLVDDVDNTMANAISDNYLVKIEAANLDSEINVAIDNGLWYLYKVQWTNSNTRSYNGLPVAVWSSYSSYFASPTASAVHAFEINGHKETGDPDEDPYVQAVTDGLNWLLNGYYGSTSSPMLQSYNIGTQPAGNPDTNGNGIGIQVRDYSYRPVYEGGMVMDAIIASGTPDANCGRDFDGDGSTDTYREVIQDMCDMYAWGQDDSGADAGGWRYTWNSDSDNSAAQWAAIGMIPAQEPPWNCVVPTWVKTENNKWLDYSYYNWNSGLWGGFGYIGSGYGAGTTPSGMVQVDFVGATTADPRWVTCERWFADNWKDVGYDWLDRDFMYGYYSFAKAMRLAQPSPVVTFSSNGFDWYRGSSTKMGMAKKITNRLVPYSYWSRNYGAVLETSWAIIILKPVLFAEAPIACFDADPNPSYADIPISFDPSCSGHSEAGKDIDNLELFEWDWDNDGVYDQSTTTPVVVTHTFSPPSIPWTYPVTLRVTDDNVPARTATYVMNIDITNPPHPPVAQLLGPYMVSFCPGDTLALDGSGSYDPDEGEHEAGCPTCPDDTITAYEWDLNDAPWTYPISNGPVLDLGTGFTTYFPTAGLYDIGLRVTDNTELAYPASGQPNLIDETFEKVDVYDGCICDLTATVYCQYVLLSWGDLGADVDHYEVYRSFLGPTRSLDFMKSVTTNSAGMGSFAMEKDHWYRVMAVYKDGSKCLSKAVYVYAEATLCNPTADAGGPYEGCLGSPVTLDGSGSTAQVGDIIMWDWDLDNDGAYDDASGVTVQHTWNSEGTYDIGLKVTSSDSLTLTDEVSTTVKIKICGGPTPVPEFTTIALPVAAILGLLAFVGYRKRKREEN